MELKHLDVGQFEIYIRKYFKYFKKDFDGYSHADFVCFLAHLIHGIFQLMNIDEDKSVDDILLIFNFYLSSISDRYKNNVK